MKGLAAAVGRLAADYPGPGGAAAVLRDGVVLERHAWGWADSAARIPFTPATPFAICSITKQFTCALLLDLVGDPAVLDPLVAAAMPLLGAATPGAGLLCHNQSGLRDYWATAMLCGAPAEGVFGPDDAAHLIGRTQSLHFTPGTQYSYANQNFRLLSDAMQAHTGRAFAELLRERLFDRAGMATATVTPQPGTMPGGTVGYEGTVAAGFRPAVNRIHWTGDAGITASLDDMIAWERFIDNERDSPDGLYGKLTGPATFSDGRPAFYRYGLARSTVLGHPALGHAGGLRGWRSVRLNLPSERLSVVVLFNHMANTRGAALNLLRAVLDIQPVPAPPAPVAAWSGTFLEPDSGLLVRLADTGPGRGQMAFSAEAEPLQPTAPGEAWAGTVCLRREAGEIRMTRGTDGVTSTLQRLSGAMRGDVAGVFHSAELGATLTIDSPGGVLAGAFSGFLGQGEMTALIPAGPDVWRLPCPRALDYAAPGDWTLRFSRDAAGQIDGVVVGCWLARQVAFRK